MTVMHQHPTSSEVDADTGTPLTRPGARRLGLALLGLLLIAVPFLVPGWVSFLVVVGIFFLVVLGLDLFLGHTGQVSLGQTLFLALGGYGGGILSLRLGIPTAVAMVLMALLSAAVAFVLGRSFLRLRGYYLALATLGLAVITESLATGLGGLTGGPSGLVGVPNIGFGSFAALSDAANYWVLLGICAVAAWFISGLVRSRTGRALAAIASDQPAAAMLGIDGAKYKTSAFVVAAVFASVGGTLYACYSRFISPDMVGVLVAFNLVVMLALGGSRTIVGPLLGVFLLQWLPEAGQRVAPFEPLIAGVVLIVVITYLPEGLWGGVKKIMGRFRR